MSKRPRPNRGHLDKQLRAALLSNPGDEHSDEDFVPDSDGPSQRLRAQQNPRPHPAAPVAQILPVYPPINVLQAILDMANEMARRVPHWRAAANLLHSRMEEQNNGVAQPVRLRMAGRLHNRPFDKTRYVLAIKWHGFGRGTVRIPRPHDLIILCRVNCICGNDRAYRKYYLMHVTEDGFTAISRDDYDGHVHGPCECRQVGHQVAVVDAGDGEEIRDVEVPRPPRQRKKQRTD